MSVPTFLQSKTYSTNSAATTHVLTLDSAVRYQNGAICPSTLVMTLSYDGVLGDQCSSITDSQGNTWQKGTSATNLATVNGEMWYAFNVKGGGPPTITVNMASSVKMTMCCVEVDQVRPVAPLDITSARIDTTSSTARTSAATLTTKRVGMLEVIIGGIAWSHVSLTCSNGGSGFAGTLVTTKDAGSGIGVGMARRTTDTKNITGASSIGRFTMSASGTSPCAVMSLSFFRDGVVTTTAEDGFIDNIEGAVTVDNTTNPAFVYRSSTSAPLGGTGGSERSCWYAFFPDYSANLITGVTLGANLTLFYNVSDGFDDGFWYVIAQLHVYKNAALGSTLDAGDETPPGGTTYDLGTDPTVAGERSVTLVTSTDFNTSGYTNCWMGFEGDTAGSVTGTYSNINTYDGNVPAYLLLSLNYPNLNPAGAPPMTLMNVGC